MKALSAPVDLGQVCALLRAEPANLIDWLQRWQTNRVRLCVVTIVVGAGLYGASMGYWRDGLQALYTGIKFPLVILLTTCLKLCAVCSFHETPTLETEL